MNSGSFSFLSKVQDIKITPENVSASYDELRAFLNCALHFIFREPRPGWELDIISITGVLKLRNPNLILSERTVFPGINIKKEREIAEVFSFELDGRTISKIEKYRNRGDIHFLIDLTVTAVMHSLTRPAQHNVMHSEGAIRDRGNIHFDIPKSVWVERVLPNLGYQSLKFFELPLTHRTLKEAYENIITEFNLAEKYFNQPDYNKCVAHCRSALDALHLNLKKLKDEIQSDSAFKWLKGLDSATLEWLDKMDKANGAQTNKSHHAGLKRDFTRHEAESIYLVTLGLLNFIAYLK